MSFTPCVMGRATQGVKLINLGKRNDCISSVCQVPTQTEDEVNEGAENLAEATGETATEAPTENITE
jgi:DNA gyrase subunit A